MLHCLVALLFIPYTVVMVKTQGRDHGAKLCGRTGCLKYSLIFMRSVYKLKTSRTFLRTCRESEGVKVFDAYKLISSRVSCNSSVKIETNGFQHI